MMKLVATFVLLFAAVSAQDVPTDGVALAISGYGVINIIYLFIKLLIHFRINFDLFLK